MLHLSDRHCLVLLPFLHGSWLCPLFRRWLSSVLTAHVLCRQLVGLLHKSHLLVHRGSLAPLAFQFRLQRCDALQQFVHLRIVVFRLVVEVSERGVQVTVGGCGGLDLSLIHILDEVAHLHVEQQRFGGVLHVEGVRCV